MWDNNTEMSTYTNDLSIHDMPKTGDYTMMATLSHDIQPVYYDDNVIAWYPAIIHPTNKP